MTIQLRIEVALGAMSILRDNSLNGDFSAFGVSEKEYGLMSGSTPWLATDRSTVRRVLDCMIWGIMDSVGVPRFQPPMEYIAAVLSTFVSGNNLMVACRWIEGGQRAEDVIGDRSADSVHIDAHRLFSFIILLRGQDKAVRDQFEKRVGYAISKAKASA